MKPGSVLDGRFALASRLDLDYASTEAWVGVDARLDAPVTVLVVSGAARRTVRDAAQAARVSRDARLARILDVGHLNVDGDDGRTYVVLERPSGLDVATLVSARVLPLPVARALVVETAKAIGVATALGFHHGGSLGGMLTVSERGRVILAGAGVVTALTPAGHGDRAVTERDDALGLARLFFDAISLGELGEGNVDLDDLPDGLTAGERDLAFVVAQGSTRPSIGDVLGALGDANAAPLRALRVASRSYQKRTATRPVVVLDDAPPVLDTPRVDVATTEAPAVAPDRESTSWDADEDDEWGLDALEVLEPDADLPPVSDAVLVFVGRRFPALEPTTRRLRDLRTRLHAGPTVPTSLLIGIVGVSIVGMAIWAVASFRAPFVYTGDLHNPPPHAYPSFTFWPDPTPSATP